MAEISSAEPLPCESEDSRALPPSTEDSPPGEATAELVPAHSLVPRPWLVSLGLAVIACLVVPFPSRAGLWDPYELNVAELARRLAVHLFHADGLALANADPTMPHLDDLGRGELPFILSAGGFAAFGLREWAGRLPFILLAIAGALIVHAVVRRASDGRAAVFAVACLVTMPLFAVQAHALIGDIVAIVAVTGATLGLGTAAFGMGAGECSKCVRTTALVLGLVALAAAVLSRGVFFGAIIPLATVALAGFVMVVEGAAVLDAMGVALVICAALATILLGGRVAYALGHTPSGTFSYWLGSLPRMVKPAPTFDAVIADLGHAIVPWAGLAPFALGRMTMGEASGNRSARTLVVTGLGVAYFVHSLGLASLEPVPFLHVPLIAMAVGMALRDIEKGARPSLIVAIAGVLLVLVVQHDFREQPEKLFLAFNVRNAVVPEAFKALSGDLTRLVLLPAALFWVALLSPRAEGEVFDPRRYVQLARNVLSTWEWGVAKGFASLSGMLAAVAVVLRYGVGQKAAWALGVPLPARQALMNVWWAIPLAFAVIVMGARLMTDVISWAFDDAKPLGFASLTRGLAPLEAMFLRVRTPGPVAERVVVGAFFLPALLAVMPLVVAFLLHQSGREWGLSVAMAIPTCLAPLVLLGIAGDLLQGSRAAGIVVSAALAGFAMNAVVYPKLSDQLSPKGVFDRYTKARKSGDEMALLAVGTRASSYYAGGEVNSVATVEESVRWLAAPQSHRRFLLFKGADLPRLDALWRAQSNPMRNLPILDDRSSEVLLAVSALTAGEVSNNALDAVLPEALPVPQRPLNVDLDGRVTVVGIDLLDMDNKPLDGVSPGRKFRIRTLMRVLAPVGADYDFFVHIDGANRRRHNGDHKVAKGRYPTTLWRAGDLVVDDFETSLEPNFGPGNYTIFFGLYLGDQRLKVRSGTADPDGRINGGTLRVQ